MKGYYFLGLLLIAVFGCKTKQGTLKVVTIHLAPLYQDKIFLDRLPYQGEKLLKVDSAKVNYRTNEITFNIPADEQRIFRLRMRDNPIQIYFINDTDKIDIYALKPNAVDYYFSNSPVNSMLRGFLKEQAVLSDTINRLSRNSDSLFQIEKADRSGKAIAKKADSFLLLSKLRDYKFVDTTRSPGAFLFVYNRVDFGKDYQALKRLMISAGNRFPDHKGIQNLKNETLQYIRIFEEEYNVGDTLPNLSLPDFNNQLFSLSSLKGKYYFLDIGSAWCPQCGSLTALKAELKMKYPADKFEVVNIAMEPERAEWEKIARQRQNAGIQLLDEKIWSGKAALTLKFDSIPFNFLISPEGRIIAKAVSGDTLTKILGRLIK